MEFAEIFLNLQSASIDGDSRHVGFAKHIDLFDWSWGVSLDEAVADAQAGSKQQALGKCVSLSKAVDSASTGMLQRLESGEVIPKAVLIMAQTTQKKVMVKIELSKVLLLSCKLNVESNDEEVFLDEDWTMTYDEMKVTYQSTAAKGASGASVFTLAIPRNTKMELPVRHEKPASSGSTKDGENFTKKDIQEMFDEFMKKHSKSGR